MALLDAAVNSLNRFETSNPEDSSLPATTAASPTLNTPTPPPPPTLDDLAKRLQIPGNVSGITNVASTGETVTKQGPPIPTVADFAARLGGAQPNPGGEITVAPDSATNERNFNMNRYGTAFPGELSNASTPADIAAHRLWQSDNGLLPYSGGGRRGRSVGGVDPESLLLAQHRDAREEMAGHLAVIKEAASLHHQALTDHDTQGFLSEVHGLDLNSPTYERDLAILHGKYPHADSRDLNQMLGAMEKARGNVLRAQEAGGGNQFEEGSHAKQDYSDTLKSGGSVFDAIAKGKATAAAETRLQKYFSDGLIKPEDFGTADTWSKTGLYTDNGRVNWQAVDQLAAKNKREQVNPAQAKLASSQNANFDKRGFDSLSPEEQTTYKANQLISRRYARQITGQTGVTSPTDLRAGLDVTPPTATPTPATEEAPPVPLGPGRPR